MLIHRTRSKLNSSSSNWSARTPVWTAALEGNTYAEKTNRALTVLVSLQAINAISRDADARGKWMRRVTGSIVQVSSV